MITKERKTNETDIAVSLELYGSGKAEIETCLLYTSDAADE